MKTLTITFSYQVVHDIEVPDNFTSEDVTKAIDACMGESEPEWYETTCEDSEGGSYDPNTGIKE